MYFVIRKTFSENPQNLWFQYFGSANIHFPVADLGTLSNCICGVWLFQQHTKPQHWITVQEWGLLSKTIMYVTDRYTHNKLSCVVISGVDIVHSGSRCKQEMPYLSPVIK